MIQHGLAPFLEGSTRGDTRFSALVARLRCRGGQTIEALYQGAKVFPDGKGGTVTGLAWREAKGRKAVNADAVRALYGTLWDEYLAENPDLLPVLTAASGLSDVFGQPGSACQATELWRIRCHALGLDPAAAETPPAAPAPTEPAKPAERDPHWMF